MFVKDAAFRPKAPQSYAHLSPGENVVAYKQFSIHSRAHPSIKPTLNKHELGGPGPGAGFKFDTKAKPGRLK